MKLKIYGSILMLFIFSFTQAGSWRQASNTANNISINYLASPDTCAPPAGSIFFTVISLSTGKIQAHVAAVPGAISYNWYINGSMNSTYHSNGCNFNVSKTNCDIEYDIAVEVVDTCGTTAQTHANAYMPCDNFYRIFPNPAKGSIKVSVDETKVASSNSMQIIAGSSQGDKSVAQPRLIYSVRIADKLGNIKKTVDYKSGIKSLSISLAGMPAGLYIVSVFDNVSWNSQSVIVE